MIKQKVYTLTPKQKTAWALLENPQYRRYLFDGGARSGKTDGTIAWLVYQAVKFPGARILIARLHLDHARTTIWNLTLKKLLPTGTNGVRYLEGPLEARFPNGSVIRIGGLDDADRVDKILGDEYLHIFINEATQISWDTVTKVLTRLSQNIPGAVRKLIMDCNPKGPRHWLHQVGVQHILPGNDLKEHRPLPDADAWARLSWTPYDNPFLPADTIRTLEALPGIQRRRMLLGEWCNNEGAVYDMFDQDVHTFDFLPDYSESWPRFRAIDFGYTNPFCCLWGAVDGDGRLWIYRELYRQKSLVEDLAPEIIAAEPDRDFHTVADPENAEGRDILNRAGVGNLPAVKDVISGIQAVQQRFAVAGDGRPRIFISTACVNTINELYEYRWEEQKEGRNAKEEPVKANDHAMDAMRYMVMAVDNPARYEVEAASERDVFRDDGASAFSRYF